MLHRRNDVAVGIQSDLDPRVAEALLDDLRVHVLAHEKRCGRRRNGLSAEVAEQPLAA